MRIAVVTGPGTVELREEPAPVVGSEEVLVEVGACGLCTMERRLFAGEKQIYPVAPGHEAAGKVVEIGEAVRSLPGAPSVGEIVTVDLLTRCGVCVQCRRGRSALCRQPQGGALSDGTASMGAALSEFVRVHASRAFRTGTAPIEHAAMGEPLACVVHSVRLSGMLAGDRVAIIGAGYMGRLHHALCRSRGAGSVGFIDISSDRLEEAGDAGADWGAIPEDALEAVGKQDVVFITAGAPGSFELAFHLCDDAGTVVLYGAFPKELTADINLDLVHHHEISIVGVYSQEPEDWATAGGLLQSGALGLDLERLVTARYGLDDVGKAFQLAATSPVYRVLVGDMVGG